MNTLLQTSPVALQQLPWLQDLPDRLQTHQIRHSQLHAAGDSSPRDDASEEEEAWVSLDQDSSPNRYSQQQQQQQQSFPQHTAASETPQSSNHQQQQIASKSPEDPAGQQQQEQEQQSPSKRTAAADAPEDSDAADTGSSLYHEHQQIRLELQDAVEHQLTQIRGSAALQARTHLQMRPLIEADQEEAAENGRPPLIHTLTSEYAPIRRVSLGL